MTGMTESLKTIFFYEHPLDNFIPCCEPYGRVNDGFNVVSKDILYPPFPPCRRGKRGGPYGVALGTLIQTIPPSSLFKTIG
jgi:hypothetical protein